MGKARTYTTLSFEACGFGLVILLIWADEYFDLPHVLFGAPPTPIRISELLLEAGATLLLGTAVMVASWRSNQHITQLETLLLVCGSCRREWQAFEAFVIV